jgi:hypothetical protein
MNYLERLKSWISAKTANQEIQKYKTEIAILSALILLFILLLSFSESVRFFGKEHPGILIVAISVACEVVCDLRTEKTLLERIKIFFGICLVIGLLLEIVEAAKSDIQVEKLREGNLVLKTNVLSLSIELAKLKEDRTITPAQQTRFLNWVKIMPKTPIWVVVCNSFTGETRRFALKVRETLDLGPCAVDASIGPGGMPKTPIPPSLKNATFEYFPMGIIRTDSQLFGSSETDIEIVARRSNPLAQLLGRAFDSMQNGLSVSVVNVDESPKDEIYVLVSPKQGF